MSILETDSFLRRTQISVTEVLLQEDQNSLTEVNETYWMNINMIMKLIFYKYIIIFPTQYI